MSSQLLDDFFRRRILLHVLFWAAVIGFNVMVYHHDNERYTHTLRTTLGFLPGHMIFVYGLIYWCMPRFVFPGNWAGTVASFLLVLFVSLTYLKVADVYLLHYSGRRSMLEHVGEALPRSLLALLSTGGPAVSIYLIKVWYQEKETRQRLNEERLMAELSSLKAQLQPHFLFNTLNNIYALTMERSVQVSGAILTLSALLRYIIYECNGQEASLQKEIDVLKDYIALQRMRYGERLDISLCFGGDTSDKRIAPLLLLPLLENSFKHGTGEQLDQCWIMLDVQIDGQTLRVKLANSRSEPDGAPDRTQGIGLAQVRKRLALLYPGSHSLHVSAGEDTFTVALTIQLENRHQSQIASYAV